MTTSKGTIQGYNGVATADKKHQVIINAQAFGSGQEQHTLKPVLESIKQTFKKLNISSDIYQDQIIITADTGFADEENMKYLHDNNINGYIPDNQFRSRDPKFKEQKEKYGKRHQNNKKKTSKQFPPDAFNVDLENKTCVCPAGNSMWLKTDHINKLGHHKLHFEGRISVCRECTIKNQCMRNPASSDKANGHGRQVSFILNKAQREANYTDWMKERIDSDKGKQIYGHRMSVIEPVFANIESNKKLNSFTLRGQKKVQAQWQMYCMVHNIEKLMNYGELAA